MYFRPNSGWLSSKGEKAERVLMQQPVIVDYGHGSAWTSTSSESDRNPDDCPLVYSCPSIEYPGLIKFAVHNGVVTTADSRCVIVSLRPVAILLDSASIQDIHS